ncbi:MAG TPA: hypothetical protein VL400_24235 [Polyangiaceae bacterium]|jgi:hypothetical protein|nr:hypothetical protein [Polyangiaceae bacterium]
MSETPTMTAYVDSLPDGLDALRGCQQKASIFRQFIGRPHATALAKVLPAELRGLVEAPPPATEWISEVKATAVYLALRDLMGSDDAFLEYTYEMNRRLLSGPLYRVLFALVSPERVIKGAASRWGQLHRGTELRTEGFSPPRVRFRLVTPVGLVPEVLARAYGSAYRVAIELAGARSVDVTVESASPTAYTFALRWE